MDKGTDIRITLNEHRRAALAEIDNAKFSWFHLKVTVVAGVGFFTAAYDIFAINFASTMLGYVYGHSTATTPGQLTPNQDLGMKVATPVGTLFGQLFFGWLADVVGRKRMYGVELVIIIVCTFAQAIAGGTHAVSIIGALVVWRVLMGIGIGGDYPLSATIASEFAATRIRGRMLTAVFAAQGWGSLAAALVSFIVVVAFKNKILAEPALDQLNHIDYMWRILIGFGCIPAAIALYFRLTIPETPRFTMDIERNVIQATDDIGHALAGNEFNHDPDALMQRVEAPRASWADFCAYFGKWENGKVLLGTAISWFALDTAFYGLGLNSSIILTAIGFGSPSTSGTQGVYDSLYNVAIGNLILAAAGLIPGYYACFFLIDSWGRRPIQLMGFIVLTVLFAIMGFGYDKLVQTTAGKDLFVFLYCLTNFFSGFGPNTTTFVIPGEVFPTRYRSTAHGISAASGKLGAIIAQVGFSRLANFGGPNAFVKHLLEIFALFMLIGAFSTLLLPETKQRTLEELSNEKQDDFVREGVQARHIELQDFGDLRD